MENRRGRGGGLCGAEWPRRAAVDRGDRTDVRPRDTAFPIEGSDGGHTDTWPCPAGLPESLSYRGYDYLRDALARDGFVVALAA